MIQPKAVALLLERGASVNAIDRNGGLPLPLAGGLLDDCLNRLPTQAERNWNEISMGLIS